jgi:hypothetical protein
MREKLISENCPSSLSVSLPIFRNVRDFISGNGAEFGRVIGGISESSGGS